VGGTGVGGTVTDGSVWNSAHGRQQLCSAAGTANWGSQSCCKWDEAPPQLPEATVLCSIYGRTMGRLEVWNGVWLPPKAAGCVCRDVPGTARDHCTVWQQQQHPQRPPLRVLRRLPQRAYFSLRSLYRSPGVPGGVPAKKKAAVFAGFFCGETSYSVNLLKSLLFLSFHFSFSLLGPPIFIVLSIHPASRRSNATQG
jgi:hypothetical protein